MSRVTRAWQAIWLEEIDARPLARFRILFGLYLLWYFLRFAGGVELAFSSAGVPFLYGALWVPSPALAWALHAALLVAAAAFAAGVFVRVTTPVLLALFLHHHALYLAARYSAFDQLVVIFLVLCCAAPTDARWSLTGARRGRIAAWAPRLVLVQLVALYVGAALWKLQTPDWRSGEIVRRTLQGMWATDAGFWVARQGLPDAAYDALAWGTVALELALPVLLLVPRARLVGIALGTAFHLTLATFLHVEEFVICVVAYAALERAGAALTARPPRAPPAPAAAAPAPSG